MATAKRYSAVEREQGRSVPRRRLGGQQPVSWSSAASVCGRERFGVHAHGKCAKHDAIPDERQHIPAAN